MLFAIKPMLKICLGKYAILAHSLGLRSRIDIYWKVPSEHGTILIE